MQVANGVVYELGSTCHVHRFTITTGSVMPPVAGVTNVFNCQFIETRQTKLKERPRENTSFFPDINNN